MTMMASTISTMGWQAWFTGKERDAETGLDYFGARYMSSAQGRFTSPDPIVHPAQSDHVSRVPAARVGHHINVTAVSIASTQEADCGWVGQLRGCPETFARHRPSGPLVDQANQVQLVRHRGQLPANGMQGEKKSAVFHDRHLAPETRRRTMKFQPAANSLLTVCLTPGAHPNSITHAQVNGVKLDLFASGTTRLSKEVVQHLRRGNINLLPAK